MIKAIIFDLNGVFVISKNLSDRFKEKFNLPIEEFMPALKETMAKLRLPGAGDAFSRWKPFFEKWKINLSQDEFYGWLLYEGVENKEMVALARELKNKGLKLFILSNNFTERSEYYDKHFPFLKSPSNEIFDHIYYSWQTGLVKPDPRCFQKVLEENNLQPEECLYFDDSQANVDSATNLGIKSYLFKNTETTKNIINS